MGNMFLGVQAWAPSPLCMTTTGEPFEMSDQKLNHQEQLR
jgi:hypothetical protein